MSKKVLLALALMGLAACSSGNKEEQLASRMLGDARFALRHGHYDEARDSILSMRRHCSTASRWRLLPTASSKPRDPNGSDWT